jgi:cyanate permease
VHQIAFLEPSIGRASAGLAVAITTAMAIAGRFVMGALAARVDMRRFSAVSFASQGLSWVLMIQTGEVHWLLLLCAVNGFSVGNLITLPSVIVQREFPAVAFGMLIALSTAINQFIYAFGPALVGALRDFAGSYGPPLLVCAALNFIAAGIILIRPAR